MSVLKATAEQIRLAQMIFDKNDADFEDKVNQVKKLFNLSQTLQTDMLFFSSTDNSSTQDFFQCSWLTFLFFLFFLADGSDREEPG